MAFADDKTCIIDKMKGVSCAMAERADVVLQAYTDVPQFLFENTDWFDCNRPYMYSILDCIDPAEFPALDIYYDGATTTINNPVFVAKYTADDIVIDAGVTIEEVAIMASTIGKITISNNTTVKVLTIGNGATVDVIETLDTSSIFYLRITSCQAYASTVGMAAEDSVIDNLDVQPNAVFGGYKCLEIVGSCADDVSAVTATDITTRSITISWTPPVNTISVSLYYRFKDANEWTLVLGNEGDSFGNFFNNNTQFIFRDLKFDTYYDFKVVNICEDGIPSAGQTVSAKTLGNFEEGP